mmetsp:Transcript_10573/g.65020  ORF Transcript_10573/g.65020 Transcript_10573/m.65020 type:complete len:789 (-) Transcript_10573:618-2984(-)
MIPECHWVQGSRHGPSHRWGESQHFVQTAPSAHEQRPHSTGDSGRMGQKVLSAALSWSLLKSHMNQFHPLLQLCHSRGQRISVRCQLAWQWSRVARGKSPAIAIELGNQFTFASSDGDPNISPSRGYLAPCTCLHPQMSTRVWNGHLWRIFLQVHACLAFCNDSLELLPIDRLLLEKNLCCFVQNFDVAQHEVLCAAVGAFDQVLDLLVDLVRRRLGVVRAAPKLLSQKVGTPTAVADLSEGLAEAHLGDHHPGRPGHLHEVVAGARGDVVLSKDELIRNASTESDCHLVFQVAAAVEAALQPFLAGGEEGESTGTPSWDDADLGHGVVLREQCSDQRMTGLVVRDQLLFLVAHHGVLLLRTSNDAFQCIGDFLLADLLELPSRRKDGGLVHEILKVGSCETRGTPGHFFQVHVLAQLFAFRVHLQDLDASLQIRPVHGDLPVKAPRTEQGLVQHVRSVGGRKNDHPSVTLKPVHLREQLVDRLLPFVVASTHTCSTLPAHRVDLVDEHNARGLGLGFLEEVTYPGGAHANKEFHELRGSTGEEGHAGLAGDRLGQERLSRTRRAHEEASLGNLCSQSRVLVRTLEEVHDFLKLDLGPVHPSHVVKEHAGLRHLLELGLGLSELHGSAATAHGATSALGTSEEEEQPTERNQREEEVTDEGHVVALALAFRDGDVHPVLGEQVHQLWIVRQGHQGPPAIHGGELQLGSVLAESHAFHFAGVHGFQELGVSPVGAFRQSGPVRRGWRLEALSAEGLSVGVGSRVFHHGRCFVGRRCIQGHGHVVLSHSR